ncbi:MAG: phage portal protein [Pseudomonadota bacterium]
MSRPFGNLWSWLIGATPIKRRYDGAGGAPRWNAAQSMPAPNTASLAARMPVQQRARYLAANNGHAAAGVEVLVSSLIGQGVRPQAGHPSSEIQADINRRFGLWCEAIDENGVINFGAWQASMARGMVRDGEAFAIMETRDGVSRIRQIDPDQVDGSLHRDLGNGRRIIAGVESQRGTVLAYHIFPESPDQPFASSLETVRVDAADVIHLMRPLFPGQVRGISWFAPVLLRMVDYDSSVDALLVRLKVEAMHAGFITDMNGGTAGYEVGVDGDPQQASMEPGTMRTLGPGQDVRFSTAPQGSGAAGAFLTAQLREIAAGLGCTYEQLTGDLTSVNYSSIRAGLVEFRRRMETVQQHVIIPRMIRPVWRRWLTTEILSGRLNASGFERDPELWLAATYITSGWPWVDPQKEIEAEAAAVENKFKSRREVVAGRGRDIDQLDAELAAEGSNIEQEASNEA